jgi:hypothetical protein
VRTAAAVVGLVVAGMAMSAHSAPYTLSQTFNNPIVSEKVFFGSSVAIDDNRVLVGAPKARDIPGRRVGQAYLFDATTGSLLQTFNDPTGGGGDDFGNSVSIDGNYVLIGAHHADTVDTNVGQAQLFNATTGALLPPSSTQPRLGVTISVSQLLYLAIMC